MLGLKSSLTSSLLAPSTFLADNCSYLSSPALTTYEMVQGEGVAGLLL
jgi:hypothetical protein